MVQPSNKKPNPVENLLLIKQKIERLPSVKGKAQALKNIRKKLTFISNFKTEDSVKWLMVKEAEDIYKNVEDKSGLD